MREFTSTRFGGPLFNPTRMTWIKPSFAWMMYRVWNKTWADQGAQGETLTLRCSRSFERMRVQARRWRQLGQGAVGPCQGDGDVRLGPEDAHAQAFPQPEGHPDRAEGPAVRDVCGECALHRGCDPAGWKTEGGPQWKKRE